jgi:hypothetical protein
MYPKHISKTVVHNIRREVVCFGVPDSGYKVNEPEHLPLFSDIGYLEGEFWLYCEG